MTPPPTLEIQEHVCAIPSIPSIAAIAGLLPEIVPPRLLNGLTSWIKSPEGALDFNTLSYLLSACSTTCSTVAIEIKLVADVYSKQGKPQGTDARQSRGEGKIVMRMRKKQSCEAEKYSVKCCRDPGRSRLWPSDSDSQYNWNSTRRLEANVESVGFWPILWTLIQHLCPLQ